MRPEMFSKTINDMVKAYTTNDKEIDVTNNMKLPIDLGKLKPNQKDTVQVTNSFIIDGKEYIFYLIVRKDDHVILAHITE